MTIAAATASLGLEPLWVALAGAGGSLLFLLLAVVTVWRLPAAAGVRHRSPLVLIEGDDGRLSTSKAQWFVWTAVIAGAFVAVYTADALKGLSSTLPGVPGNVLTVLGFSTVTMATAKGITTVYTASGRMTKTQPGASASPPAAASDGSAGAQDASPAGGLLTDDQGITDLSKIQLMTWTLIAVGVYSYDLAVTVGHILGGGAHNQGLPDIGATLMVLMGLSQGGYLGKKLVQTTTTPAVTSLIPSVASPGESVAVYGTNFGPWGPDAAVLVDGRRLDTAASDWTDGRIRMQLGQERPGGAPWAAPGSQANVSVVVVNGGAQSSPSAASNLLVQVPAASPPPATG